MSLFVAWFVYPLVLLALCVGCGLLVDLLSGQRLPGALVAPAGLAAIVVVGQLTTIAGATAELTVPLVCFGAALGFGLSWPWRFGRPDWRPIALGVAVFAIFGAPVFLSGHPTFAGYIKLDDTATWLALTDGVMQHGREIGSLEPSTYRATLEANLPGGYPVGVFLPFGVAQQLVGGDLAWVFQPYLSFLGAMLSLCLWQILGDVLRRPSWRLLAAFVASQPALLFGYALWGGVKELGAALLVALAAALGPIAVRPGGSHRDAALLALPAAGLVGVLGVGGLIWLGPMLAALAYLAAGRLGARGGAASAAAFAIVTGLLAIPGLLAGGFDPLQSGLTSEGEIGNLVHPLNLLQALGIWPSGDFRTDPASTVATAVLLCLAIVGATIGCWTAWRRRAVAPILYATSLVAAAAIAAVGSPWVDAKALATAAPAALALAIGGAAVALRIDRVAGGVLVAAVAGGVLWSNVLAYGGVDLAPYAQLAELQRIGSDFAGEGPALMTEYNPYGARHFLRRLDAEGVSELRVREVPLRGGGTAEKGEAVDTDELDLGGLLEFRTLVVRRSPAASRPPSAYRLVWSGRYYEVWRQADGLAVVEHLPLGGPLAPAAVPDCDEVRDLGLLALQRHLRDARLLAARHGPVYDATDGNLTVPRAGDYEAWLLGSVRGDVELYVDGRKIGDARQELENEGGFVELGWTSLDGGAHHAELRFGGADLHPGSGGFPRPATGPLLFSRVGEEGGLVSVPVDRPDRLCDKPWDWLELVASSAR